jgi:uncharacterized integral membrane protein
MMERRHIARSCRLFLPDFRLRRHTNPGDPADALLVLAFRLLLFVLLFGFALKNSDPVTVRFYLGSQWEASLALVVLVFFGAGVAAGAMGCFAYVYRERREILQLRKELRAKPGPSVDAL